MRPARVLSLQAILVSRHAATFRFGLDDLSFSTTCWYEDVDLLALAAVHPDDAVLRLLFHVAVFEAAKLCSLRPDVLDLGPHARFWTPALATLWRDVFRNVWAQWRYEHDDPDYLGPDVLATPAPARGPLRPAHDPPVDTLLFCGGGKDSLVAMRLLERADLRFDTLGYSSSIYGPAAVQHALIDGLAARSRARRHLRQWIFDDFLDAPITRLRPELGAVSLTAAETPCSIFAALPLVLHHGHRSISLAHERSADEGQLRWARTGEDINHQWGKSAAAESAIGRYITDHLLADFSYHSVLKPIYDPVIFGLLRRDPGDLEFTHSCNLRKPWCMRCPKCLYVWLGCAAFLPADAVRRTFGADAPLTDPARIPGVRALLGEGGRQPFECIGRPDEVRLYLAACAARDVPGAARLAADLPRADLAAIVDRHTAVDFTGTAIPPAIRRRIEPELIAGARETRDYLGALLA